MRSSRRRILGIAILAVWIVMLGLHVRREYFRAETLVLAEGARGLAPGSYFYIVRMNDAAIGLAVSSVDTLADGFALDELLTLDVPALDTMHRAVVGTQVELSPALELRNFRFRLDSEIGRFQVDGRQLADSALALEIVSGGETQRLTMPIGDGVVLPAALPLRIAAAGRLESGREFGFRVFDPSVLAPRDVVMRVTAHDTMLVADSVELVRAASGTTPASWRAARWDTVPVWRLEEAYGGVVSESWVDEDGRVVRASSPLGFTMERTMYELAQAEWARSRAEPALASGYGSIIESTAIASDVDLDEVRRTRVLRVRLLGVDLGGFDLEGGRQTLRGDTLVVRQESADQLAASYSLPYRGSGAPLDALGSTPLIQANDPRIQRLARRIARSSREPAEVARRLNAWVHDALRKDITLSVPSALQVLERREGDCNEHTVLYVALARALGLPARTAVGVVDVGGRFYYHAWPEVWLDGWVAVDPTLDQFPADASHLRFLNGGLARQVELIRLIGRLRLETA
ncbi:MAG: transglutaminase-like domain-containing protein [Longimicrobiales bacterium]